MSKPTPMAYLCHIRDECVYIEWELSQLHSKAEITENERTKRAIVQSLNVIGEATKQLPDQLKEQTPEVEWTDISGMRNYLVHEYFGIDYNIVWQTMNDDIPKLKEAVEKLLQQLDA